MSATVKRIAVVGGGINGVMTAWMLAQGGHRVELFESGRLMQGASSASTKLLHGGLRYLEFGHFSLVREALHERWWWLRQAPQIAREVRIVLPVYRDSRRSAWKLGVGLKLYDWLAGRKKLKPHERLTREEMLRIFPALNPDGLRGGYAFSDGQMDDYALGLWAAEKARAAGVLFREDTPVERVTVGGEVVINGDGSRYDLVYNIAGPWASELLARSNIKSSFRLSLVRGSHLIVEHPLQYGLFVQVPVDSRFVFILPYKGRTLVGTTEVPVAHADRPTCSEAEQAYLLSVLSAYLGKSMAGSPVVERFAGLRPLVVKRNTTSSSHQSREYAIERQGALINVFGGKWTTSRALGLKAAALAC